MHELQTIDDLRPAPYNPREIDARALDGLGLSVATFGDLSGIVWNARSGHLVCGHQRMTALRARYPDLRLDGGALRAGPHVFPVRVVDWDDATEKAANVAANATTITGTFTSGLAPVLAEISAQLPELSAGLRLAEIRCPVFDPQGAESQGRLDERALVACPECGHEFAP